MYGQHAISPVSCRQPTASPRHSRMPFRISDRLDRHAISSLEGSATLRPWHDDKLRLRGRYNGSHTTSPTTQRRLIHIRLKQHIIQQDPRRRSANDRSGSFYQQSRFRPTKPFTSSDVPRGTVPAIYSFVDIWINNYGVGNFRPQARPQSTHPHLSPPLSGVADRMASRTLRTVTTYTARLAASHAHQRMTRGE